jgi:hypothetical protein
MTMSSPSIAPVTDAVCTAIGSCTPASDPGYRSNSLADGAQEADPARGAIFLGLEDLTTCRHRAIGMGSPIEFEKMHADHRKDRKRGTALVGAPGFLSVTDLEGTAWYASPRTAATVTGPWLGTEPSQPIHASGHGSPERRMEILVAETTTRVRPSGQHSTGQPSSPSSVAIPRRSSNERSRPAARWTSGWYDAEDVST